MPRIQPVVVAGVALLTVACSKGGTIEGDLTHGAAKGAYRTVILARNTADSLLGAIDAACQAEQADIQRRADRIKALEASMLRVRNMRARTSLEQVAQSDSIEKYRQERMAEERAQAERPDTTYRNNLALIKAAADTSIEADAAGHFRFGKLKPSKYVLYAEWLGTAAGDVEFLAPVDMTTEKRKVQNLDQSMVSARLRCK